MAADDYGLDTLPWEMQPNETAVNFAAFVAYRSLGPRRTLRKALLSYYGLTEEELGDNLGKIRTFEKWSSRFKWRRRVEEYDRFVAAEAAAADVEAVIAMRARHAQMSTVMQSKVINYLNQLTDADLKRMTPDQAMRVLDLAIKNERLARGVPDTITAEAQHSDPRVSAATPEVTTDALERKFEAFLRAHDPDEQIERGEPERDDDDEPEGDDT